MPDDYEFLKKQVEATDAKQQLETLQSICVYCGEIMQHESMEQKRGAVGNQMRIDHIKQCTVRPELKLIAYAETLRAALQNLYGFLKVMPATRLRFGDEDAVTYTMLMDAARAVLAETGGS